ncbi:hypothetical protein AB8E32_14745 [Marinomonas polaris]|uniref:Cap15 family cyclic dinucleotide receptor domain-containing protein n=1 Tax=Marinomonas polaris TaxID=293552 RepID=UPI0035122E0B
MANIALSTKEFRNSLFFVSVTTIVIGIFAGLVRHLGFEANAAQALILGLFSSVSWAIAVSVWAFRLSWKIEWLARLTGRPIIHGLWYGYLQTNYGTNDEDESKAIPIAFVIKQTYLGYSLLSYTENQDSRALVESLSIDDQHEIIQLRYMYEFYIRKPNERKLTTGAAELRLIESGKRLKGHYLTNSPTQGFADLTLVQRSCDGIDTFAVAKKLYQNKYAT